MIENMHNNKFYMDLTQHHLYHAICGHSFSKNDESIVIVMDGGGGQFIQHIEKLKVYMLLKIMKYLKNGNTILVES